MKGQPLDMIRGQPPNLAALPPGCSFAPRCSQAVESCHRVEAPAVTLGPGLLVRCVRAQPPLAAE
ncbi:oligopeptide transporter ATP-binding component [compost metagenome]